MKKGWWQCKCGTENGKGFKLCQKYLELKPKYAKKQTKRSKQYV